jgi:hypothetical protein
MTKPLRKLKAARDRATTQTLAAGETRNRMRAIVDQVIEEMEKRRTTKRFDYVSALADELQKGGLSAWKELKALLPREDAESNALNASNVHIGSLFAVVAAQVGARARDQQVPIAPTSDNMIDVTSSAPMAPVREVIETAEKEDAVE